MSKAPEAANRASRRRFLRDARAKFRASWRPAAHRELRRRFPEIFNLLRGEPTWRGSDVMLTAWGIEYPKGWHPLVVRLAAKLTRMTPPGNRPECVQVKEKFGSLRFYVHWGVPGELADLADKVVDVIDAAEEQSRHTCEICGRRGSMQKLNAWLSTLCDRHAAAERRRIAAEVSATSYARRITAKDIAFLSTRAAARRERA